jgi:hypothetical protein
MKKVSGKEPFLTTLARGLGRVAGSVAKGTQELTTKVLADKLPASSPTPRKGGKRTTGTRSADPVSPRSRRKPMKKAKPAKRRARKSE